MTKWCMLCCDISTYRVRCRWLFAEIGVNNTGYACSAIAWASRMLELLREEEVQSLGRKEIGIVPRFLHKTQ